MDNPRAVSWKGLITAWLTALWDWLTGWIGRQSKQSASAYTTPAYRADFVELCGIKASVYEVGSIVYRPRFLERKGWIWWFDNPAVHQLQDALDDALGPMPEDYIGPESDYSKLKCRAVCFEFYPVFNPQYVSYKMSTGSISAMDVILCNGQQFADEFFEGDESDSIKRMAQIAIANADEWLGISIFIGVFNVWYDEHRDEDGGVADITIAAEFVREFSLDDVRV